MPLAPATLSQLRAVVGADQVFTSKEDLIPYAFDGTAAMSQMPGCVAFVTTTEQIVGVLKLANTTRTPSSRAAPERASAAAACPRPIAS